MGMIDSCGVWNSRGLWTHLHGPFNMSLVRSASLTKTSQILPQDFLTKMSLNVFSFRKYVAIIHNFSMSVYFTNPGMCRLQLFDSICVFLTQNICQRTSASLTWRRASIFEKSYSPATGRQSYRPIWTRTKRRCLLMSIWLCVCTWY